MGKKSSINEAVVVDRLHELNLESARVGSDLKAEKQAARLLAKDKRTDGETQITLEGTEERVVDVVFATSVRFDPDGMAYAKKGLGAGVFNRLFESTPVCGMRPGADVKLLKKLLGKEFKKFFETSTAYAETGEFADVYDTLDKKRKGLVDAARKERAATPKVVIPKAKPAKD